MANYKLQARISDELAAQINEIAETIKRENPGAEADTSTITRYALEDYMRRYSGRKNKNTMFFEIPIGELNENELYKLEEGLKLIKEAIKSANDVDRRAERKLENTENIGIHGSEILEKDEVQKSEKFSNDINYAEKLCDEKIMNFLRKKFKK